MAAEIDSFAIAGQALIAGRYQETGERHIDETRLTLRRVSPGSLAAVEIPLLSLIIFILAVSALVAPDTRVRGLDLDLPLFIACPFYLLTDIPCIFCGLTRSFMSMGGLDIRQAFIFHPLGPLFYAAVLGGALALSWSIAFRRRMALSLSHSLRKQLFRSAWAVLLASWLVKVVIWRYTGLL